MPTPCSLILTRSSCIFRPSLIRFYGRFTKVVKMAGSGIKGISRTSAMAVSTPEDAVKNGLSIRSVARMMFTRQAGQAEKPANHQSATASLMGLFAADRHHGHRQQREAVEHQHHRRCSDTDERSRQSRTWRGD